VSILRIKTLNYQKTNVIEKGISILMLEHQFLAGIKKFIRNIKFDLVIYSTPPITFTSIIKYIKQRDGAKSYLLLKDIFPQNAVDIGVLKKGWLFHRYFSQKEKGLYKISDFIGCMSPANVEYLIQHNPGIDPERVEVNPNSIEPGNCVLSKDEKQLARNRYTIPVKATIFIYGGNLGKPQGIDFLIKVLDSNIGNTNIFFIVVGSGTEFPKIQAWFIKNRPLNAKLISGLKKSEYDMLVQSCDVGMIFLDRRYTIPNFPSRLLSYLEYKMPVLAATDSSTDLGRIMIDNNFGYWAESGNLSLFNKYLNELYQQPEIRKTMGENGNNYLLNNFTVTHSYSKIMRAYNYLKEQEQ
jgi:glycosyltransferase involved in cell wall biosynthesis